MNENISILLQICITLGVVFDEQKLNDFDDECEQIQYLLEQIYYFLGGNNAII